MLRSSGHMPRTVCILTLGRSELTQNTIPYAGEHHLQQVGIRVAEDGFVAILKNVTTAAMTAAVVTGVASQQRRHQFGKRLIPYTDQQVIVIGHH